MIYFITEQTIKKHPKIIYKKNISYVTDYFDYLEKKDSKIFTLDTETISLDPYDGNILLIQIGDNKNQYVIDFRHSQINKIFPYLADDSYIKILANTKFDYKQLWHSTGIHIDNTYDILLAERCIYNGLITNIEERLFKKTNKYGRFSLEGLSIKYLNKSMPKMIRNTFIGHKGDFSINQILYAAGDIDIPYLIYPKLLEQVKKYSLEETVKLENQVTVAFSEMEFNGINIDLSLWNHLTNLNKLRLNEIEIELDKIIYKDDKLKSFRIGKQFDLFGKHSRDVSINWGSPKQKIKLLNLLGFNLWVRDKITRLDKESVDVNILKKQIIPHSIIAPLIEFTEVRKSVSSYGEKFLRHINPHTKRIHTSIFQIKETGRTGSGSPNMQNIPSSSKYRECFIADEGNVLITTDYSNMELRIIAEKSGEQTLIDAFNKGEDVHSSMAMMIQKVVYGKEIIISKTENSELRIASKTVTFLIAYGGSAYKLADNLNISVEDAQHLIDAYFKAFPKLKVFSTGLQMFGIRKGYIRTFNPFKRLRWFPKYKKYKELKNILNKSKIQFGNMKKLEGEIKRASSNTPIQGSAADIMKKACYDLHKYIINFNKEKNLDSPINKKRVKLLLQVHDEIIVECKKEYAEEITLNIGIIMEKAADGIMKEIRMIAEPNIDIKWQK